MKRNIVLTILACGASLMLGAAAQAQTPETSSTTSSTFPQGRHHHDGVLEHLTHALDLSGTQQAEIAPILEAAKPQLKAVYEAAKTQRNTVITSVSDQITPLLTGTQQARFAEMVQHFEERPLGGGRHFGHGREHGGMLEKLTTSLGLSTQQQADIKPILEAAHTQVKAIRENTSLTQDEKFAQIKTTMDAAHSQINGLLSPAQQSQLAAMKEKFHHHWKGGADDSQTAPGTTGTNEE